MAARTAVSFSGATGVVSFSTRETVLLETLAFRAISWIVIRFLCDIIHLITDAIIQ
jgi:hypothetical protein